MTAVPIDAMRDIRNESDRLKFLSMREYEEVKILTAKAECHYEQSQKLRDMADKWVSLFPETKE